MLIKPNSLVLYKHRPARVVQLGTGDRFEIELDKGETARVRFKDMVLLHPGPINSLVDLKPQEGEVSAAWEILAGERAALPDLAELIYGTFTPATAWAAWRLVEEGLYFEGTPESIYARTAEEVTRRQQERAQAEAQQHAWQAFLARARKGIFALEDREYWRDVETLAQGRSERSVVMRELGRAENPDNAHSLLLEAGVWDEQVDPYPIRLALPLKQPDLPVPALPEEERLDLTHLPAFAIDDQWTDTPDDAISLEGNRLWVHVADVAALVEPDSPLDLEARSRGTSLHLPEGTIHLLPREVTLQLGLGLQEISPALSFGIDLDDTGQVTGYTMTPSRVRVTRLTYEEAEQLIDGDPLAALERYMTAVRERRRANGAVMIDFPEAKLHVEDGKVDIHPLPPLRSRAVVEESMILTGAETARFAVQNGILMPFSQQDPVDTTERPDTLSGMFAMRRLLKRSAYRTTPGPHSGLAVPAYTQVTSPLRRYLDLVGHQQLRAFIKDRPRIDEAGLVERIGAFDAVSGGLRQAEMLANKHWTIVYLLQHPGWRGEGILVEKRGSSGIVLIPALAMEARVHLPKDMPLDAIIPLALKGVNLSQRDVVFRVEA